MVHYIDLLETAARCVAAQEDTATGVCLVPSDKRSYSQSTAVQVASFLTVPVHAYPIYKAKYVCEL